MYILVFIFKGETNLALMTIVLIDRNKIFKSSLKLEKNCKDWKKTLIIYNVQKTQHNDYKKNECLLKISCELGVVFHTCNSNAQEREEGGLKVQDQP